MSDDAAKALKLAQKNEKQINLLWKKIARLERADRDWAMVDAKIDRAMDRLLAKAIKANRSEIDKLKQSQDKRFSDLYSKQEKKLVESYKSLKNWMGRTLDKNGLLN